MKKSLLVFLLIISFPLFSQRITVNTSQTPLQLIQNVLLNSGTCAGISNVTTSAGLATTGNNSPFGSYVYNGTNNVFTQGMIISTGHAVSAGNTTINATLSDNLGSGNDVDLASAYSITAPAVLSDAAYIQFDFVPIRNTISFRYFLASEEYEFNKNYPCQFSDAFAFLIKDVTAGGAYQNIALIPSTTIPVGISTVHPDLSGLAGGCPAVNATYFNGYNQNPPNFDGTNFNGSTKAILASANVIPGHTYHIKLVIADYGSTSANRLYDSAVFLEGGSFNLSGYITNQNGTILTGTVSACTLVAVSEVLNPTYQWFKDGVPIPAPQGTAATYQIPAGDTGVYKVIVTDSVTGCVDNIAPITITALSPPTAISPQSFCAGATLVNLAATGSNIKWYSAATGGTPLATSTVLVTGTTYYVSQTVGGCESTRTPVVATIGNVTPIFTITSPVCSGGSITLPTLSNNSVTGSWNTTPNNTVTTTYTFTPDPGQCANNTNATVVINPLPTATISGTTSVCQNATAPTITFTGANATAPYIFTYNIDGGTNQTVTSVGNTATITVPTTTVGTFTVNLVSVQDSSTSACSQLQSGTAVVTINPLPTATVSGTTAVCLNATAPTITFTGATGTSPYTFTYNINGATNQTVTSVGNTATITVPSTTVGTFTVNLISVQDSSSTACSQNQSGTAVVTVNPLPSATISGTTSVCLNDIAPTITFTGANSTAPYTFTYNIDGAANQTVTSVGNTATITVPTSSAGAHNVNLISVQDSSSTACSQLQSGTAVVTVNPLPTATVAGTISVCQNGTAPTITFTGSNATAPYTFTYTIDGAANQTVTSVGNTATITVPTTTAGVHNVNLISVRDSSSSACTQLQSGTAVITVNASLTATISSSTSVCLNDTAPTITFTGANATAPYTFTYTIDGAANQTVTSVGNTATITIPTTTVGTFTVNLISVQDSSATACSQTQTGSAIVTVNPLPTATIAGTTAVCVNDSAPTVTFTGASATAPYTFTYNIDGATNVTVTSDATGVATITVPTTTAGTFTVNLVSVKDASTTTCSQAQTGSAIITVNPLPTATVTGTTAVCLNGIAPTITFTGANATAPYTFTYNIDNGANQTITSDATGVATITMPTTTVGVSHINLVSVQESSATTCSQIQTGTATVTINEIPSVTVADVTVCAGTNATVTAVAATAASYSYAWTYPATATDPGSVSTFQTPVAGPYTVVITNVGTGCVSPSATGTVSTIASPTIATPIADLHYCDPDNDGVGVFDLATLQASLLAAYPTYTFTFHETPTDAATGAQPVPLSYTNIDNWTQTIYIRVLSSGLPCYTAVPLNLIVDPTPVATTPQPYHVCDDDTDGIGTFDLTTLNPTILGTIDPALNTVAYYLTLADAQTATGAIVGSTAFHNTVITTQTIYAVVTTTATGCTDIVPVILVVDPLPMATQPGYPAVSLCETTAYGVGFESFDLQGQIPNILLGQTGMNVTFYPSLTDAQAGTNVITSASYVNTIAIVQTLGVRVTNAITGCYVISTIDIRVEPLPVLAPITPLHFCDADNDGVGTFDLATLQTSLIAQYPGYTGFSFFETATDAMNNTTPSLPLSYNNINLWNQTIYIRVQTALNCVDVFPVSLVVDPTPVATTPAPYHVCDDNTDGIAVFDLTTLNPQILGTINPALNTVAYYTTLADAQGATNPIGGATAFSNTAANHQTIYAAVITTATQCQDVVVVDLYVDPLPTATQPGYPAYSLCETPANGTGYEAFDLQSQIPAILLGQTGMNVTFYPSLADAQAGTNAIINPSSYVNTIAIVQTLGIRVTNATTGCYVISTIDIRVQPLPVLASITPLHYCDADNDGVGTFDLATLQASLMAQYPGYTNFSFYETPTNAQTLANPLPLTYNNIDLWNQTIYIRVETIGLPCYDVFTVNLVVDPTPVATTPTPYHVCDDNTDGISVFNLTTLDAQILGTLNPALNTVTYYPTLADAQAGTNPIGGTNTYSNTVANHQTIYAAVITNLTGCRNTVAVDLYVDPIPTATQPAYPAYSLCETPANGVGFETFNLTAQIPSIIGTQTGVTVIFYPSLADAQAGTNAIVNPSAYVNAIAFVQTLGIRVSSTTSTGCFAVSTIDIRVQPLPVITPIAPLHYCDADNDGVGTFDLATLQTTLIAQYPAYTNFSFYETPTDAQTMSNPLALSYNNINLWNQTIYIRVETIGLPCYDVFTVNLVVDPTPVATTPTPYHVCDDNTDGISVFNLTTLNAQILGALNPALNTVAYYTTLADAQAGTNPIAAAATFANTVVNHQTIYAAVITNLTGCRNTAVVELYVDPIPTATQPAYPAYSLCETPANGVGFETFNLTAQIPSIVGTQTGVTVIFYPSLADAQAGTNAIVNPSAYVNATAFVQTLGIRVSSITSTGCYAVSTIDIRVQPLPAITALSDLHYCDPNNDGVGVFDLTTFQANLATMYPTYTGFSVYETPTDAATGNNPLPSPYNNIDLWNQTVYVQVNTTGAVCSAVFPLHLVVDPTPVATTPAPYHICDDNADGIAVFNLTTLNTQILGALSPALNTVAYYTTLADAQAGTNPISAIATYANTVANHQTIYAAVITNLTGCRNTTVVELYVDPLPTATQPGYPAYSICETPAYGIGFEAFNLQSQVQNILLGQMGVGVTFYPSLADAQAGTSAIANPAAYVNTTAFVQTLGIRLTSTSPTACYVISTIDIRVQPLPVMIAPTAPFVACDTDQDGITQFDLCSTVTPVVDPTHSYVLTFYETQQDAINGFVVDQLPCLYTNINNSFVQFIYVRAQDPITGCYSIMQIELNVDPSPVMPTLPPMAMCDYDNSNQNGCYTFDLTAQNAVILAAQGPGATYTVSYYLTQADASHSPLAQNPIVNASSYYTCNGQVIWVRVENNTTHCFAVGSFTLSVNAPLSVTAPAPLKVCDNDTAPNDLHTTFDLTVENDILTGVVGSTGYTVNYYNHFVLPMPTNGVVLPPATLISNPATYINVPDAVETLLVEVINNATGCKGYTTLTIRVLPVPKPNTNPATLAAECETVAGSGVAVFNLTTNANYIMNNDPNVTLHYYPTENDMAHHTNEIMTPAAATVGDPTIAGTTINLVQYVYIAVTSNIFVDSDGYNCYVEVKQGFIVNPLPVVATIPNLQVCQDLATNNGIATFDLTSVTTALLVGNSTTPTSTYSVAFYTSNPPTPATLIIDPVHYVNTASPFTQTIYVVVTNTTTTCTSAVGQFTIVVNPKPVFATVMNDLPTCDTDGVNDGMFMYTQNPTSPLTGLAGYVSDLLGPTQQTGFTVTFYENYADALAGTVANAITNLATYQVHSNMYWVRIENDVTHCFILDSFEVIVEPLPQPVIFTDYDNHVICATFNSANHTQDQVVRTLLLQVQNTTVYPDFDNNPATYPVPTYNYQWYLNGVAIPGATSSTYLVQTADPLGATRNYTVTMTSTSVSPVNGCSNPTCTPFPVIQSGQAVAIGTSGGYTVSNAFQDNQTITVTIDGWGAPDYQYSLDNGPMQTSPVFDNVSLGEHTITVWDVKGGTQNSCDPLVIEKVETINYPHYFTPNGDGIHDSWNIVGLYNQPNAKIYIFDRFGKLIKQISPQSEGWDGTYNGNTLPSTDYWFTVDYSEDNAMKQFKAHFSLKR